MTRNGGKQKQMKTKLSKISSGRAQAPFLPNDVSRCDGVEDEGGWRKGCKTCLRRIAPRGEYVSMFLPPPLIASECEYLIESAAPVA